MDEKELQRLYNAVNSKFDIGGYDDFRTRMQTPEDRKKFYDVVGSKGFDLGQYPFYEERLSGVKKKQSSDVGSTPLGSGVSNNQDIENEPVPAQVGEYQQGEPDVFELTKQYNDFSKAEKVNYRYEPQTGATVSDVTPDQEKRDQAKGIKQSLMDLGIENPETFYNEIKDLTPTEFGTKGFSKQELIADRKENYNHYLRKIGTIKWRRGLESELADRLTYNLNEGGITKEAYDNISGSIQSSLKSLRENVGDYRQQRDNARNISFQIKQFGGQKKDELLANYAADISKLYGNAYKKGFEKYAASAPESKYLDNNALLAYEYLQDVSPEKAKQYELLLRDPKTLKDDPDALSAYNRLMLNLKETGIGLQKNAINEDLNSLVKVSKENDGLTPEQLQEVEKLQERLHTIETFENTLDSEYPERIEDEVDDAAQEIMGQKTGYASYVPLKAKNAVKNTVKGVWEMVSEPFLSDESNQMRELSIMGESVQDEKDTHKVDKNVSLQTSKMVFDPELKSKLDTINDDNSLTYGEKEDKIQSLLRSNRDKFGRVEIAGGKMNVSPASIAYGVTDLATTLLPFFAVEAATGGIGGAGTAAKFFRTANAALLTGFHDHYAESLNKGLRGSNAYFHAMGMTSIDAAIMAGAGTVEAVKAFYKGKNLSSSKVIEKLSDKEIQAGIDRGLSKGLKSVKQSIVDRVKATPGMIAKGAKTGAEFEVAMAAGEQLKGALNNERIDPKEQTKRAVLGIINFAGMASVLGHAGYKSPNDLQRSYMVDIGKQPDGYKAALEKMRKDGDINKEAYEEKLSIIDRATEAYKTLPKYNSKGKPITEAQKGDYIMQTVAKNEHDANKKNLPPKQAADAELKSKTADYVRQMILDEPTDKQLETQLSKVEKSLEPKKDADGKIEEMPENERLELKAEKDAIEFIINERKEKGEPLIPKEEPTPPKGEVSTVSESEVDSRVEEIENQRRAELEKNPVPDLTMDNSSYGERQKAFDKRDAINKKYDAEIAALPKQEAKPTVSKDKKADIERRRQEDLNDKAYNIEVTRTEYKLEDGRTLQISTYADGSYKIFSLRGGEIPNQIAEGKNTNELTQEYLEDIYGENFPEGVAKPIKTGQKDKINAKYDAEIAALPKQEAKPTVSSEGELTQRQLDNREKKRIEDIVESVEGGDIKGSSISVGDKDLVEYLIDAGMWGREAHVVKGEIEGLIKPLKRITDKIDPEELKFLTENVEDINSVMEGLEDAKMIAFSRNKDIVDGVNKEAKRLLDFYSDKNNLADNKLDTESTFAAKVDLLDKFLKGELNYLDLSKFGVEKKAKDYFKPKIKQEKRPTQSKDPSTPVSEGKTKVENEVIEKPVEGNERQQAEEIPPTKAEPIEVSEGGGEPPKGEAVGSGIYSEPKRTEFSHRGLQEVATEFGLDPVTSRERVSDAQLFRRADETLTKWQEEGSYNKNIKELMKRGEEKKPISDEENVIMAQHIAQLREQGKNVRKEFGVNSKEYDAKLSEINDAVRVGEAIRSQQGAALRVPIFSREYMPTLEDAMTAKMDAVGTDVLTPKQKVEVEKQFEKIEKERDEYKAKLEAANAKFAEMQAQSELSKPTSKGKTTTGKRDYKAERQSLKDRLKEEVAAYKAAGQKVGIASDGGAESFVVSAKIAKTITEIARTHVAEAGAKIKEVVEKTLEDVREYFGDKITDRDIMDVLAGKYNEKRKTRSQLAADMREVQTEAKLLNEYQRLLEGGEPKNEKRQIQRNKRLAEIRKELKGLEELDKEIQSSKDAELQVRIDKNKDTVDKLDKLEKEDARAAEKKRKEIEAENLKELAKLKEEFDKKVRENERKKKEDEIALNKKLKEQADEKQRQMDKEAREYEQKLRDEEIQRKKDEIALVKELDRKLKYKSPAERAAAQAIERNKKREQEVREKITNKDFDEKKKPASFWEEPSFKKNHPDLYKQVLDSYNKKEEAQLDYELELLKDAEGKKTKTQKVLDWLGRGANTTKKVVTGIDDSSLFMQTLAAMTARPFVAWQAIRLHALDAVSKKRFDRNLAELHNSPDWDLMKKSGLDVTEPKSLSATAHEEAFSGKSWDITFKKGGKEYKVLQTMLSPFERAFTSLGNGMRVIAFRSLAEKFEREGHTFENNPQLYKDLATMLNTETGRGKQNELIERASNLITKGIWSPKLMASRLNMLGISDAISFIPGMDKAGTKGYYRQLTPEIRKQALKDLAKFSATVMAVSSLVAYALGGKVDNDPDSVTYLDIQTPDGKSYNISGGFAQYIKLVAQTISGGKRKNGILEEFKGEKSEGSNIMRFGRGKLTPLAGVITDFATGKDFMGKEVEPLEEAKKLAIPLSLQSVATELKRDGLSSLFTATLPSFVGIQVKDDRDFEKKGDKKQGMPQKKQKPTKEKKFAP